MRIALIAPYLPAPANSGGRTRIWKLATALASRHEVSLYARAFASECSALSESPYLTPYAKVWTHWSILEFITYWRGSRRLRLASSAKLANQVRLDHAQNPFDMMLCCHSHTAGVSPLIPEIPMFLDEHNIESRYVRSCHAARRESFFARIWERNAWRIARGVSCVSAADAKTIGTYCHGTVGVAPNGIAHGDVPFRPSSARTGKTILFVGMMSFRPNVRAARFLAEKVLPRVLQQIPDADLVICGRDPCRAVLSLAGPRVTVTGTVPSVIPYLENAAVYGNALFEGAGSSLKVPEALAAGIPLVSTRVGVRGFDLEAGRHYLHAENPDEFAEQIVNVLRNRSRWDDSSRAGHDYAKSLDWSLIGPRFLELVESAMA
jgi:polysaccharide biosynthesis protein PslH